ncbi:MAG: hypothetical protein AB2L14_30310 [Candidatus Xenobiia bacterium LiM19]
MSMKIHDSMPAAAAYKPSAPPARETGEESPDTVMDAHGSAVDSSGLTALEKMKEALIKSAQKVSESAEKTSEYIESSPKVKTTLDTMLQFFKTIKSFPRFIYPSLINMTADEKAFVLETLDKLPLKDVGAVKSITMLNSLPNASGAAAPLPSSPFILLTKDNFHMDEWAGMVLTHETGHAVDYNSGLFGLPKLLSESSRSPWGQPPYITPYAQTGPGWYPAEWDDFAESYAYYHAKPNELQSTCPEKFNRIQEMEKNGFFDSLIDRKEFRETGKLMGSIMEKAPYLQNGLAMVSLVGGLVQAFRALGELKRGEKTGDEKLIMNATMNFAAGSCFASKVLAVPGMAIEGARAELNRAVEKDEITAAQANAVVQATVGMIAGPLGNAINWVISKMPWGKTYEISDNTLKELDCQIADHQLDKLKGMAHKELTRSELKHILKKLEFGDGEIDTVNQYVERPKEPDKGDEVYVINVETLQHLKGALSEEKLEALGVIKDKKLTESDLTHMLKKAGFKKDERELVNAFTVETEKDPEPVDVAEGSLARAGLIGAGGALGAVGGGFAGPYLGVLAGFAIGGPIGGVIGLVGGALLGFKLGSYLGGRAGNLAGKALEHIARHGRDGSSGNPPALLQTPSNLSPEGSAP